MLTAAALLMGAALVGSVIGLIVDPRMITGAPAWLKPAKFAVSTAIYMLTLAWIFTQLPDWPRTRRVVGWVTAVILVLEVAIIDTQAWRGTTSHFNVGTILDGVLFSIMGLAIVVQTVTSVAVAVALWRQRFGDRALGWALRFGMVITILGASTGGLMTRPTVAQLEEAGATGRMTIAGAHTVGAPDGGPGLPGTGWSVEHGDLRIPHFVGLHAMQILPLLALALRRRRSTGIAARAPGAGRGRELRRAVHHPALAGTARAVARATRRGHDCCADDLGDTHRCRRVVRRATTRNDTQPGDRHRMR